jgi:predicted O-linked N-acetylglucosamine transferase (SPINDLY family)
MSLAKQTVLYENEIERAVALLNRGLAQEALTIFQFQLAVDPNDALTCYNCALAYHTLKNYDNAVILYKKAIARLPAFVKAYHNLGQAYEKQGNPSEAINAYETALQIDPGDFKSSFNLCLLYHAMGNLQKALPAIQAAIRANPDSAEAFCTLGMILGEQHLYDEASVCLEQSLHINPKLTEAYFNLGIVSQKSGKFDLSLTCYKKAIECDSAYAPARWLYHLSLPMLYNSPQQIDDYRKKFKGNLKRLIESTPLETDAQKTNALRGIGTTTNFYLQYQCRDDLELQKMYGDFVHSVMVSNYPQWSIPKNMPPLPIDSKIRIGYVSTFMCNHTVGHFLAGWLENHTHCAFEIHCYHLGKKNDAMTRHLMGLSHRFHNFGGNFGAAARRIDEDALHLLIYTDIGMDPTTTQLAALRLAPIQCKGWGHPVTTGLPTIDYYLSSDLMEPANADAFYSESLVRLPNLALCYRQPPLPDEPYARQALGIADNRFLFLSTQSIFKYLPQHDDIYPRIAKAAPRACFVFIRHRSDIASEHFQSRLKTAFAKHGLDSKEYCHFSKRLKFKEFLQLNIAADVLLDSIDWSGGKTTLEALSCGLPVVTLPGRFMRGRHAYAMLHMMDVLDTIAGDKSEYCDIAIRLCKDSDYYDRIKTLVRDNRHKLYNDQIFIAELENFYRTAVTHYPDRNHNRDYQRNHENRHRTLSITAAMTSAWQLRNQSRCEEAAQLCHTVLTINPSCGQAWHLLGLIAHDQADPLQAIEHFKKAISKEPDQSLHYNNLAVILISMALYREAEVLLQKALHINPGYHDAICNLGLSLYHQKRFSHAATCFNNILADCPQHDAAQANLGMTKLSQQNHAEAAAAYQKAIALNPNKPEWHGNLGAAYMRLAQYPKAVSCYRRASQFVGTDNLRYSVSLAIAMRAAGDLSGSIGVLEHAISMKPDLSGALANLVVGLEYTCNWKKLARYHPMLNQSTQKDLIDQRVPDEDPMLNIRRCDDVALNQAVGRAWSRDIRNKAYRIGKPFVHKARRHDRSTITIGYLSYDFRNHPVAHQLFPLYRKHDRNKFRVIAFSMGPDDGSYFRQEVETGCDEFVDIASFGLMDAAQAIYDRQVDILIDMMGHSHHNRMGILALRPAPLQVGYLGFLSTTGADFIDYVVTDKVVVPDEHRDCYDEKLIRMPLCYQLNHQYLIDEAINVQREDYGLPASGFVFCSFNNPYKIDRLVFDAWMKILHAVPRSVLWLNVGSPAASDHMKRRARTLGIDPQRIVIADKIPLADHLKRLPLADLALDTLRYNGGATTSNALSVGLPLITVMGRHWVSRMSASHLIAAGVPELVFNCLDDYEQAAVRLAGHPEILMSIRHRLNQNIKTHGLFDANGFVRHFETGLEAIWHRHLNGQPPDHLNLQGDSQEIGK